MEGTLFLVYTNTSSSTLAHFYTFSHALYNEAKQICLTNSATLMSPAVVVVIVASNQVGFEQINYPQPKKVSDKPGKTVCTEKKQQQQQQQRKIFLAFSSKKEP